MTDRDKPQKPEHTPREDRGDEPPHQHPPNENHPETDQPTQKRADPDSPLGKSILDIEGDTCPRCGAKLEENHLVCERCGFDLEKDTLPAAAKKPPADKPTPPQPDVPDDETPPPPFVTPGRGGPKPLAVVGAILTLSAMIVAGVNHADHSAWVVIAATVVALAHVLIHSGTGLLAVWFAAVINEQPVGRIDLALARMFVAYSAFELIRTIHLPVPWVGHVIPWIAAALVYWTLVLLLFNKPRVIALLVALAHFVIWIALQLAIRLEAWLATAVQTPPPA